MKANCTTHHFACDCREEYFKRLKEENERYKGVLKATLILIKNWPWPDREYK
jgi:hypothetical protein